MDEREIAGKEAVRLFYEQINDAKKLVSAIEEKLGKDLASSSRGDWEKIFEDLEKTITALSGLEEMGMLVQEQKALLTKLKTQQEYVKEKVLPQYKVEKIAA